MAKTKDLWKTLKSLGLFKKFSIAQTNAIEYNKHLKYDLKSVAQTFAKFYSTLAEYLLRKFLNSPNKFDLNYVQQYYKNIELKDNFNINFATEKKVLEILQCIEISKATGIDKIIVKFLKYSANILAKPIPE